MPGNLTCQHLPHDDAKRPNVTPGRHMLPRAGLPPMCLRLGVKWQADATEMKASMSQIQTLVIHSAEQQPNECLLSLTVALYFLIRCGYETTLGCALSSWILAGPTLWVPHCHAGFLGFLARSESMVLKLLTERCYVRGLHIDGDVSAGTAP